MIRLLSNALIVIIFLVIFSSLGGCSPQPSVGPTETVEAFFKAIIAGDTKGAMEYVEGVDTSAIERFGPIIELGKTVLEKFFSHSTSSLLEQQGKSAKVQWQIDLDGLMGGKSPGETDVGKIEGRDILRNLIGSRIEELTTTIFTLEIKGGKWKITKIEHTGSQGLFRRRSPQ